MAIPDMNTSSARTPIDVAEAAEIARMARTGDPNVLSTDALQRLLGESALVLDGLRTQAPVLRREIPDGRRPHARPGLHPPAPG